MGDPVCAVASCGTGDRHVPAAGWADEAQAPGTVSRLGKGHSVRDLAGVYWPHVALCEGSGVTGLDALEGLPRAVR